jgi:CheY-like chemotaxis protein
MHILIVEDDPSQSDFIQQSLRQEIVTPLQIDLVETESGFLEWLEAGPTSIPDIIIMDIMLRWADPKPKGKRKQPPKEVLEGNFYRAGIRCGMKLGEKEQTRKIPLILYSVINKNHLRYDLKKFPKARYLLKDFDAKKMVRAIHSMLPRSL